MHHTDHIIPDTPRPLPPTGTLYFVGVGGAGMSAIAQVLAERGRTVAGADPGISGAVRARLEKVGATIHTAHDAANVGADVSAVIVSDAIPKANPEVLAATERGIPVYRRPEVLGNIVNAGRGIAIAGTHGKTTTTGMVASILIHAGLDPTVLIGGDLPLIGGNARNGNDPNGFVVAESCEAYDGFLYLHPEVAVILNIEADHLDYHGTEQHVFDSFGRFITQIKPGGTVIACGEDANTFRVTGKADDILVARGNGSGTDYYARIGSHTPLEYDYYADQSRNRLMVYSTLSEQNRSNGKVFQNHIAVTLKVPGRHNAQNATAAVGVALAIGVPVEHIIAGLESFTGTGRRFERLGETDGGVAVIDDYAHHPTELRATLSAARSAFPGRRIVAVFQPHLPSRTRDLMDEFAASLAKEFADAVFVTDIYLAREAPLPGVSSEVLANAIDALGDQPDVVRYVPEKRDLPDALAAFVAPGDVVITLGAGDIRAAGEGLLARLM